MGIYRKLCVSDLYHTLLVIHSRMSFVINEGSIERNHNLNSYSTQTPFKNAPTFFFIIPLLSSLILAGNNKYDNEGQWCLTWLFQFSSLHQINSFNWFRRFFPSLLVCMSLPPIIIKSFAQSLPNLYKLISTLVSPYLIAIWTCIHFLMKTYKNI